MKLGELSPAYNSKKNAKRVGRGIGSGLGKTAGKGHKGQWARSGGGVRVGFEGGQKPLMRRLPKIGFDNNWKKIYTVINISDLEVFDNGAVVNAQSLIEKGIVSKVEQYGIKVLGDGIFTKKLTVQASKYSKAAAAKIEQAGGKAEVL